MRPVAAPNAFVLDYVGANALEPTTITDRLLYFGPGDADTDRDGVSHTSQSLQGHLSARFPDNAQIGHRHRDMLENPHRGKMLAGIFLARHDCPGGRTDRGSC